MSPAMHQLVEIVARAAYEKLRRESPVDPNDQDVELEKSPEPEGDTE